MILITCGRSCAKKLYRNCKEGNCEMKLQGNFRTLWPDMPPELYKYSAADLIGLHPCCRPLYRNIRLNVIWLDML